MGNPSTYIGASSTMMKRSGRGIEHWLTPYPATHIIDPWPMSKSHPASWVPVHGLDQSHQQHVDFQYTLHRLPCECVSNLVGYLLRVESSITKLYLHIKHSIIWHQTLTLMRHTQSLNLLSNDFKRCIFLLSSTTMELVASSRVPKCFQNLCWMTYTSCFKRFYQF